MSFLANKDDPPGDRLTTMPRLELEDYCRELRKTALRLGEDLNRVQTDNGKLRTFVKEVAKLPEGSVVVDGINLSATDLLTELAHS
ncbi:hypothetical protein OpiT1DRAFT_03839 [Opitutaceae bacterium TAV1]|nr:hypothetical protein OpiT1DRAFT_03839 [Opitutaceae bacterium TAV1]